MKDSQIKEFIKKELGNFKFMRISMGYRYLVDAIFICIKDPNAMNNLNKYVFPKLAEKYNAMSYIHVKWCIEQTIKTMYNNTDANILCQYFNLGKYIKPSLKFFIYTIVSKYEWKYN